MYPGAKNFRLVFLSAMGVFLALMVAGTGYTLWRLRAESIGNALDMAATHARGIEDHLTRNLHLVDLTAAAVLATDPARNGWRAHEVFADTLRHMPFLRSLSLCDARGRIVASSNPGNVGRAVGVERFLPPAPPTAEMLRIGPSWAGRDFADGREITAREPAGPDELYFVPVVRSLGPGSGGMSLLASVNPDYFVNYAEQWLPAAAGHVSIVRYDGVVELSSDRSQAPGAVDAAVVAAIRDGGREVGAGAELRAGTPMLSAFRASRLYPLVVVARLDRDHALRRWRAESFSLLGVLVPVGILIFVLAGAFFRRQMQSLRQNEEAERATRLHSTVFESSLDSIIITDPGARIIAVNPAFSAITGYAADEVMGRNPRLLSSGRQSPEFYARMWHTLLADGVWRGELINQRKDGTLYTSLNAIIAFRDPAGELRHYIGISNDITERKLQDERIEELNRSLEQRAFDAEAANRAKTAFLANMSHELRTPLNHIVGFSALLRRDVDSERGRDRLAKLDHSSQHLLQLIETILEVARLESDLVRLSPGDFDIRDIGRQIEQSARPKADAKGLEFGVAIAPGVPERFHGDCIRIAQVMGHLVDNAIKFSEHGRVSVRVSWLPDGGALRVEVEDQGVGIPPELRAGDFPVFNQGDNSQTRRHGGTGIGLALCKRLVRLMGGEIGFMANPREGSTVWFVLPAAATGGSDGAGA